MTLAATLKKRIHSGETTIGTWLSIPHPMVVETLAQGGFDFLLADGEHGPLPPDALATLLPAAERHGAPVVYRVSARRDEYIKAALDAGAPAVMVPMIDTAEQAIDAVAAARYPPAGRRGIAPWRASNYYRDFSAYFAQANQQTSVILQIETRAAVEAAEDIAAAADCDVLYIGPADLTGDMGLPIGEMEPEFLDACLHVGAAAQRHGKAAGIDLTSLNRLPTFVAYGFTLFTFGSDTGYLMDGVASASQATRDRALEKAQ